MKKFIRVALMIVVVFAALVYNNQHIEAKSCLSDYRKQARVIEKKMKLTVIDTSKLTIEQITHRRGKVLIERVIGRVKNAKGDGKVINAGGNREYGYGYICYKGYIKDFQPGDVIVSYLLYNPETEWHDDIIARWDYKLEK